MQALDDDADYVAALLKRDAEKHRNRFATGGLQASKRRADAPKPNLRFLKNVLRDVDSHNTALKLKEEEESRVKAEELSREQRSNRKRDRKDEQTSEHGKRQRLGLPIQERRGRWKEALLGLGRSTGERKEKHRKPHYNGEDGQQRRHLSSRTRSRSPRRDREHRRDRPTERHRSRSSEHRSRHRRRGPKSSSAPTALHCNRGRQKTSRNDESESDPLEDMIGPRAPPKVRHKGRGMLSASTAMDAHFRSDYDPKSDVHFTAEGNDDWDMALEALRDRAKWNAQGAERLKAAGFTDDQVKRWEKGGEKDIEDVVWRKKGEGREWDRGKTRDEDGKVETSPNHELA